MSFYTAPNGHKATGEESKAFAPDFSTIPEGTTAVAKIKAFEVVNKEATQYADAQKFIQVTYKILEGDYVHREVTQKIKCFDGSDAAIERNLNMLVLVMKLCKFTPTHNNEPTAHELASMIGSVVGITIGEWSIPKKDGSGLMEGNFVRKVASSEGFACETGVKAEPKPMPMPDSAFARDKARRDAADELESDIPF